MQRCFDSNRGASCVRVDGESAGDQRCRIWNLVPLKSGAGVPDIIWSCGPELSATVRMFDRMNHIDDNLHMVLGRRHRVLVNVAALAGGTLRLRPPNPVNNSLGSSSIEIEKIG